MPSTLPVFLVKEVEDGSLAQPTWFSEIWRDRGSGASAQVKLLSMWAPIGYTCLGHVAVNGYQSQVPAENYHCVKESLLTRGALQRIWTARGTGARRDVAVWRHTQRPAQGNAIDSGTFTAMPAYDQFKECPWMLSRKNAEFVQPAF